MVPCSLASCIDVCLYHLRICLPHDQKKEERKALSAKLAATEKKKKDDGEQATAQIASPESFHPSMFGGRSYEGMTNANKQPSKETIKKMATIAQKAINSQGKKSLSQ